MGKHSFNRSAGTVFAIVHLYCAIQALPIQIGSMMVPQWVPSLASSLTP